MNSLVAFWPAAAAPAGRAERVPRPRSLATSFSALDTRGWFFAPVGCEVGTTSMHSTTVFAPERRPGDGRFTRSTATAGDPRKR
ncbi:hypothetical protein A33M_1433 [Rhodovulum sp. PH10]|nr:hypothetical protein A33M_1433 [Rhodovulum sp. PH10]